MKIAGFDRSTEQCRLKVKKLRGEYKIRDSNSSTGESRKYWKHFDALDAILGSKSRPLIVVDMLALQTIGMKVLVLAKMGMRGNLFMWKTRIEILRILMT